VDALRFEGFLLDPETGELRKEGALVELKPQPTQVLELLASRTGAQRRDSESALARRDPCRLRPWHRLLHAADLYRPRRWLWRARSRADRSIVENEREWSTMGLGEVPLVRGDGARICRAGRTDYEVLRPGRQTSAPEARGLRPLRLGDAMLESDALTSSVPQSGRDPLLRSMSMPFRTRT
jgi:hypothetical protein